MKKFIVVGIILLLIIAAVTVPNKQQYAEWMKEEIKQESNNQLVDFGISLLGDLFIENVTTCKNFVFVSVCTTKFTESEKASAIGLFNNFFSMKSP